MEAVFLIGGWFDYTVPLGNLLGLATSVLNFFLMGLSVQKASEKDSEINDYSEIDFSDEGEEKPVMLHKEAEQIVRLSHTLRFMMLLAFCAVGVAVPCFNTVAVLIPLLFVRIAIMIRPAFKMADTSKGGE